MLLLLTVHRLSVGKENIRKVINVFFVEFGIVGMQMLPTGVRLFTTTLQQLPLSTFCVNFCCLEQRDNVLAL